MARYPSCAGMTERGSLAIISYLVPDTTFFDYYFDMKYIQHSINREIVFLRPWRNVFYESKGGEKRELVRVLTYLLRQF